MIQVKKAWEHQEIEKEKEAEALEGLEQFLEQSEAQGRLPF
jgi:beta-phosphoglucomutase-like phosphatase (HAD superfamily)